MTRQMAKEIVYGRRKHEAQQMEADRRKEQAIDASIDRWIGRILRRA